MQKIPFLPVLCGTFSRSSGVNQFAGRMSRLLAGASITQTCARQITTSELRCKKPDLSKIKLKQSLFQADNDVPVYLKGGPMDKVLYYATVGLTITGLGMSMHSVYKLMSENK